MSDTNPRKRMVVEEVGGEEVTPEVVETVKEKVEELEEITQHLAEDVKESAEVQEEIKQAVEVEIKPEKEPEDEFIPPKQAPDFNPMVIIIPGILLLGALVGGIVFYQKSMNKVEVTATPTSNPITVTATPSPVPSTKTSLTKYSIVIQNGSGVAGEAGRAQTVVESAGFKVSGTANADSYTYTKTVVKAKATVEKDFIEELVKALGKNYTVDKAQVLSTSSKDDVQVIVGSLKSAN